jgi:hypothetical protein
MVENEMATTAGEFVTCRHADELAAYVKGGRPLGLSQTECTPGGAERGTDLLRGFSIRVTKSQS